MIGAAMATAYTADGMTTASDEKVEEKTLTGDIVSVNSRQISVEYAKTATQAEEMLFSLDKDVDVEGPKTLKQLVAGDRVQVLYRQTYREDEKGQRVILKTLAKDITLLRSATAEGALRSEDMASP